MEKDEKIKFIQIFIEFCNADLADISSYEMSEYNKELHNIIGTLPKFLPLSRYDSIQLRDEDWPIVLSYHKKFSDFLNWFVDTLKNRLHLNFEVPYTLTWGGLDRTNPHFIYQPLLWEPYYDDQIPSEITIEASITTQATIKKEKITVPMGILNFFEALDNFPKSSLLRCPQCNNIFFNPTRRKKRYCSLRCQNTAAVQRLRKKQEQKK